MYLRILLLSALLFQLSACGTQKMRLVKAGKHSTEKQIASTEEIAEVSTISATEEAISLKAVTPSENIQEVTVNPFAPNLHMDEEQLVIADPILPEPTDSTETVEQDPEIVDKALQAEKNAKISKILGITSLVLLFVLGPLSIISTIISWFYYKRAKNARYITSVGEHHLADARIALLINAILLGLMILALILLIIILIVGF